MSTDRSPGEDVGTTNEDSASQTAGDDVGADPKTTDSTRAGSTTTDAIRGGSTESDAIDAGARKTAAAAPLPPAEPDSRYRLESTESAVDAVLEEVAALRRCDPVDLPPLYEAVDPDLLDGLWEHGEDGRTTWLTFAYAGCLVTLTGRGYLDFRLIDDAVERYLA